MLVLPRARVPARRGRAETLTPREQEVAHLPIAGATDKEIAHALTISEGTAGLYVHHVLAKLGPRSRAQVADRLTVGQLPLTRRARRYSARI
jgi:DNA-binding NarL/FixJ family response regulator